MHRLISLRAGVAAIAMALTLAVALPILAQRRGDPPPESQPSAPAADQAASSAGNAQNGAKLFKSVGCYQCHGYGAQGGVGPRIAQTSLTFQSFVKYLRAPTGEMPPYTAKVTSDSELADVYAFLHSLPKPPPAKDIPLLNNN